MVTLGTECTHCGSQLTTSETVRSMLQGSLPACDECVTEKATAAMGEPTV